MYTVGFVDNSTDMFQNYRTRLQRHKINFVSAPENIPKEALASWIFQERIKCLLVDYRLQPNYDFVGTELVAYINNIMPDLPCMILTAYSQDSLNENLVVKNMIIDRDALSATDLSGFTDMLKQAVDVFCKRLSSHLNDYAILYKKREGHSITTTEEERFLYLFKLLKAYGEVDEIPTDMLRPEIGEKMDSLLAKLDTYINTIEIKRKEG